MPLTPSTFFDSSRWWLSLHSDVWFALNRSRDLIHKRWLARHQTVLQLQWSVWAMCNRPDKGVSEPEDKRKCYYSMFKAPCP